MMLHAIYLPIRYGLELTQRTEIEDAAEVILGLEPLYIGIGGIVQVSRTDEPMRTDSPSSGAYDSSQVTRVVNMFEDDVQEIKN